MRTHTLAAPMVALAIALTVAEVVVGLALVILLYRAQKDVRVDEARALQH